MAASGVKVDSDPHVVVPGTINGADYPAQLRPGTDDGTVRISVHPNVEIKMADLWAGLAVLEKEMA